MKRKCFLISFCIYVILMCFNSGAAIAQEGQISKTCDFGGGDYPESRKEEKFFFLNVCLNGHKGVAIVDTGAEYTLISKNFSRSIGLKRGSDKKIIADSEGRRRILSNLNVDEVIFASKHFNGLNALESGADIFGIINIDIVLGMDWICKNSFRFSYNSMEFSFIEKLSPQGDIFKIRCEERKIILPVKIQNQVQNFLWDTGNNNGLTLSASCRSIYEKQLYGKHQIFMFSAFSGSVRDEFLLSDVEIFNKKIKEVSVDLSGSNFNCLLGNRIFNKAIIEYDSDRGILSVQGDDFFAQKVKRDHLGMVILDSKSSKEEFEVVFVARNSPAEKAGLRKYDKILKVDGVSVPEFKQKFKNPLSESPVGEVHLFETLRGTVIVTLAEYY